MRHNPNDSAEKGMTATQYKKKVNQFERAFLLWNPQVAAAARKGIQLV